MSTAFTRTLRSLEADRVGWTIGGILAVTALVAGFATWCWLAPVTLFETSATARIEAGRAAYPVAAPIGGTVKQAALLLGREVKQGEVLVELDATSEQLQIAEETTHRAALRAQIAVLQAQISVGERARTQEDNAAEAGREQGRADLRAAEVAARHAESEEGRTKQLYDQGLSSEKEYREVQTEALRLRAAAEAHAIAVERGGRDQLTKASDRTARLQELRAQIAGLEAQVTTVDAAIERLRYEMDRRLIRASMDGRLGEIAVIPAGSVIREGDKLGAIIPTGALQAVAQFPPETALGRLHPGQPARLRLDGFPWMEYGVLTAHVSRIASEVRDGSVRVEFALDTASGSRIPLQHGLPGTVEVEVGRTTPWILIMRHAGHQWTAQRGQGGEQRTPATGDL
jgi:membrane fusion protein (multidrug efflux system)